jgi:tetratricopeptide (TPR) repeat protein
MAAKNIKIFIASAGEVRAEREKAVLLLDHLNNSHKHLWLKAVWWEKNAQRGNQPEHGTVQAGIDPQLIESDIVLFIFYSRLGHYTMGEYQLATEHGKKIFVYFKHGFSPNKAEIDAYGQLLDFKESLNKPVMYEHYMDADHFYDLLYQHLNQYLSDQFPPSDGDMAIPNNPAPLPPEISKLIQLLVEKEDRIKALEAMLPTNSNTNEVERLTAEITNIREELAQSEALRQQQAADKAALEQQLVRQKESDQLKAQALEAVEKGDYATAENLLKESARDSIVETASTFYELAKVKKLQLKYREAFDYYELAAKIEPNNSLYLHDAGSMADQLGYADRAIVYYEKSLPLAIMKYGERHSEIAIWYNSLGSAYHSKGEYERAIGYYEKALNIDKEFYGERHPNIAILYNNLGLSYNSKGEYERAIEYYKQALDIGKEFYGERHPDIAIRYTNLGEAYRSKGAYDRAIRYYEQALDIGKEFYGERHPNIATGYNNLGGAYHSKAAYDRAIGYYEQALDIDKQFYGERHPGIAILYNNLGEAYRNKGAYNRAIGYHEQALDISREFCGEWHPTIATHYNNLGLAYYGKGAFDLAIRYYEQCLSILHEFLPLEHPYIARAQKNLQAAKDAQEKAGKDE